MKPAVTAVVPIRSFNGMTRLTNELTPDERRTLSTWLAAVVVDAAFGAGLSVVVVSGDPDVRSWALARGADTADDQGSGLNASVSAAVRELGNHPWIVLHADLPLVSSQIVTALARRLAAGRPVVCPSLDGGTNVIGGWGPCEFAYGPGSFTRHLAQFPDAAIIVDRSLAVEVDTVAHYRALSTLGYLPSLTP